MRIDTTSAGFGRASQGSVARRRSAVLRGAIATVTLASMTSCVNDSQEFAAEPLAPRCGSAAPVRLLELELGWDRVDLWRRRVGSRHLISVTYENNDGESAAAPEQRWLVGDCGEDPVQIDAPGAAMYFPPWAPTKIVLHNYETGVLSVLDADAEVLGEPTPLFSAGAGDLVRVLEDELMVISGPPFAATLTTFELETDLSPVTSPGTVLATNIRREVDAPENSEQKRGSTYTRTNDEYLWVTTQGDLVAVDRDSLESRTVQGEVRQFAVVDYISKRWIVTQGLEVTGFREDGSEEGPLYLVDLESGESKFLFNGLASHGEMDAHLIEFGYLGKRGPWTNGLRPSSWYSLESATLSDPFAGQVPVDARIRERIDESRVPVEVRRASGDGYLHDIGLFDFATGSVTWLFKDEDISGFASFDDQGVLAVLGEDLVLAVADYSGDDGATPLLEGVSWCKLERLAGGDFLLQREPKRWWDDDTSLLRFNPETNELRQIDVDVSVYGACGMDLEPVDGGQDIFYHRVSSIPGVHGIYAARIYDE